LLKEHTVGACDLAILRQRLLRVGRGMQQQPVHLRPLAREQQRGRPFWLWMRPAREGEGEEGRGRRGGGGRGGDLEAASRDFLLELWDCECAVGHWGCGDGCGAGAGGG